MKQKRLAISDNDAKKALTRVASHAVANDGEAMVYLGSLRLPKQFGDDPHRANSIYRKIQSDFCKHVYRSTGFTPRYVVAKSEADRNPEYTFCLFTRPNAGLDKPEDYIERGREIANSKCGQAGWGHDKHDLLELFRDAPRFLLTSQPLRMTSGNQDAMMNVLQKHLGDRGDNGQPKQRTLFVSKTNR